MKRIKKRKLANLSEHTTVIALGEPGAGGACHYYHVRSHDAKAFPFAVIWFQKGPIKDAGVNGCTMEDLLTILADRLESFQAGPFPCKENKNALDHVKEALYWLEARTKIRSAQGLEGVEKPHNSNIKSDLEKEYEW